MGGHVLWEDKSYRSTFLIVGYVLMEDMPYRRICLMEGYVLLEACISRGHVLRMMFFWRHYITGRI